MRELVATAMMLLLGLFTVACDDTSVGKEGDVVGGPCGVSSDCDEDEGAICLTDESFPEGTCAIRCSSDDDCPDTALTSCVVKGSGSVCLLNCAGPSDCRNRYTCERIDDVVGGGESSVCIGPANPVE